jgi:hypothetical protein
LLSLYIRERKSLKSQTFGFVFSCDIKPNFGTEIQREDEKFSQHRDFEILSDQQATRRRCLSFLTQRKRPGDFSELTSLIDVDHGKKVLAREKSEDLVKIAIKEVIEVSTLTALRRSEVHYISGDSKVI